MPEGKASPKSAISAPVLGFWDPSQFAGANQRAFDSWIRGMGAVTEEITQFAQTRLREDMATLTELAACKDINQAFACQRKYADKMAADYIDEFSKLSGLTISVTSAALQDASGSAAAAARESRS